MGKMALNQQRTVRIRNPFVINPFFAYSAFWTVSLILYSLSNSGLNIPLDANLVAFLVATIALSAVAAFFFGNKFKNKTFMLTAHRASWIAWVILIVCYGAEFLYSKNVPLLTALFGNTFDSGYLVFGIPMLHVIISVCSSFYCIYHGWLFLKFKRCNNLIAMLIPLSFYVLCFSRGMLLFNVVVIALLWLMEKRITIITWVGLILLALFVLWLFGVTGNIRSGYAWNDTGYFMEIAQIPGDRYSLFAPFYWADEYLICSLRNLNYNVQFVPQEDLSGLLFCLFPDAVAKRLFPAVDIAGSVQLVQPNLTTSTAYIGCYLSYGYFGMAVYFLECIAIALIFMQVKFLPMPTKVICLAMCFFLYAMTIFDNMVMYSGYSFTIIIAILYPLLTRVWRRVRDASLRSGTVS